MRNPERENPSRSLTLAGQERRGAKSEVVRLRGSVSPTWKTTAPGAERSSRGLKAGCASGDSEGNVEVLGDTQVSPRTHAPRLPCLSSNNSTEGRAVGLSQQHRKSASALAWNVQALVERHGIERVGFLTLTFADHVLCPKEAQRRFNSLATHVLRSRYVDHIRVSERQKSGRLHYHLLVVMPAGIDIRTGADFESFSLGDYRSAPKALRSEWSFWRATAKRFRFGRTELLPVRSTAEGIARYVGKYISKGVANRTEMDHGVRLVEYTRGARIATTKFAWATPGAAAWRRKVALFARIVGEREGILDLKFSELSIVLGRAWAHRHRSFIADLPELPS